MRRALLTAGLTLAAIGLLAARQRPVRFPTPAPPIDAPTFNNQVVRIFQAHCQTCHHPGDIAPFSLVNYADAFPRAADIKYMTQTHQMPPWKPADGCGEFEQARVLSQAEIDTLTKWADAGAPQGNAADLPTPLDFSSGWVLGQPDLVAGNSEAYTPPATGDIYRCFTLPTNTTSDKFVSAIDVHPGDRTTVHHVIAFLDTTGASEKLDANDPQPGYTCFGGPGFDNPGTLGGWAPGARPIMLPEDVAMSLPAGSRIVLQVHYHPHGPTAPDKTEIGVYYAKKNPNKILRILPIINTTFTIPPNDPNYQVTASFPLALPLATHALFVAPHMHLLGRRMKVEATLPNGQKECLVNVSDWDFNWQGMYSYKQAVALPALTRLTATAYYDNSADNWRNPNSPPKPVSWGEATTDEMCIAFLGVTIDAENLTNGKQVDASWIPPMFPPRARE